MIENVKLHVFRVVADTLNFSKAAEELHLSQPASPHKYEFLKRTIVQESEPKALLHMDRFRGESQILAVFHRRQRRGVSRTGRRRSHSLQACRRCHRVHGSLSYAHLPTEQMKPNPEPLFSQFKSALRRIAD